LLKPKLANGMNGAASSAISLATLPANGVINGGAITTMNSWANNPYDFLKDGARAVRAFCRPWPVRTVGVPVDMRFDIGKASFTLVVHAEAEDRPRGQTEEGEEGELATEIYVPLVHYAHKRYVARGVEQSIDSEEELVRGTTTPPFDSRNPSSINLDTLLPEVASQTSRTLAELGPGVPPDGVLDLQVGVSEGRWEVQGQMLKWWYDVPAEGQPSKEYKITITRLEGPILEECERAADVSMSRGWNWCCEQLCLGETCHIM